MPGRPLRGDALAARFALLDTFLLRHQQLWKPRPFTYLHCPWEPGYPELARWLRGQTLAHAEAAQAVPGAVLAPAPYPALAAEAQRLAELPGLAQSPLIAAAPRANVGVPGRKWQQVEAFARHLAFREPPRHWLDWCAGKGHLARRLLQPGQQATCLEYNPALAEAGAALSQHQQACVAHRVQDVLAADAAQALHAYHTPVALHACGDLHAHLITLASQTGCQQLAIAPCCYNRTAHANYQALSRAGQHSLLQLGRHDLALPATEAVTAGRRERLHRDLSMARRLGFDLLQRECRGTDEYLPTPPLPPAWLAKPMRDWCHHLATLKGLSLPANTDFEALEQQGWARLAQVRNLELLRNLFRRPLELWLVLDRALHLHEQGYEVRVGPFCPPELTPRNLLIVAERP